MLNHGRVRHIRGVREFQHGAVGFIDLVNDPRGRRNDVKVIFPLEALENNFHVEKPEESASETEAKGE